MKFIFRIVVASILTITLNGLVNGKNISTDNSKSHSLSEKHKLIATNDTFNFVSGCGTIGFGGDVITNDIIPADITAKVQYVICSQKQFVSFGQDGNFAFNTTIGYNGLVSFTYHICDENDESNYAEATVFINIKSDFDCDGIFDDEDLDDDNDGIPDIVEGNGKVDSDSDGIPDVFDIDDDNDGIPDIREWQKENECVLPSGVDLNNNGWDDAFEKKIGNKKFQAVDTDNDGIPDFLDVDSDNDEINDFVEATDCNFDSVADVNLENSDLDFDGLDDVFDIVKYWHQECNSTGSNVALPDHNNNGIADFRENLASLNSKANAETEDYLTFDTSVLTFPNPTSGVFSIQIPGYSSDEEAYLKIFNMSGELMYNYRITSSIINMDLTEYKSGIYFVKMIAPKYSFSRKLILKNL